ncbi:hypothetical protein ACHAXN_003002 [Cyclotella atomus]
MVCWNTINLTGERDVLSIMLKKEQTTYHVDDYLIASQSPTKINEMTRQTLVEWCMFICDLYHYYRETAVIAVGLFDRFLSRPSLLRTMALQERREFQLVAVTSLYIAIKLNERVLAGSDIFSSMSEGGYSIQEIEAAEKSVLCGLSWHLYKPTALQMCMQILAIMDAKTVLDKKSMQWLVDEVHHQTELAVHSYNLSLQRPSTVGVSILFLAIQQLPEEHQSVLLGSLLSITQEFDFDKACQNSISSHLKQAAEQAMLCKPCRV